MFIALLEKLCLVFNLLIVPATVYFEGLEFQKDVCINSDRMSVYQKYAEKGSCSYLHPKFQYYRETLNLFGLFSFKEKFAPKTCSVFIGLSCCLAKVMRIHCALSVVIRHDEELRAAQKGESAHPAKAPPPRPPLPTQQFGVSLQ